MTELYVLLEAASLEKIVEADTLFKNFGTFNDISMPGPKGDTMLYSLSDANIANILGWCFARLQEGIITHFQVQENDDQNIATRLVAIVPIDATTSLAYAMDLNDDVAYLIKEPPLYAYTWRASQETLEGNLRAAWPNALFISLAEMRHLFTRCGCGKEIKSPLTALCVECDREIKARNTEDLNGDQAAMLTDYTGSRMGQKPDLCRLFDGE